MKKMVRVCLVLFTVMCCILIGSCGKAEDPVDQETYSEAAKESEADILFKHEEIENSEQTEHESLEENVRPHEDTREKDSIEEATNEPVDEPANESDLGEGGAVPALEAQGQKVVLPDHESDNLDLLIAQANAYGVITFSFNPAEDIDDHMLLIGLFQALNIEDAVDFDPDEMLYFADIDVFQAGLQGLFGRSMLNPQKFLEGYIFFKNDRIYWSAFGFEDGYRYSIVDVFNLNNDYYKVVCSADYYDPDHQVTATTYTAIVKKDDNALHGYYLIAQDYGVDTIS